MRSDPYNDHWVAFQSPSYRGGSTPTPSACFTARRLLGFNPLLIGAGALPLTSFSGVQVLINVSIPFLSGREHSHSISIRRSRGHSCFNPLLIGAGALPQLMLGSVDGFSTVSIPSYRGGSTPLYRRPCLYWRTTPFQSPSYRGGSTPGEPSPDRNHPPSRVSIPFLSGREHSPRATSSIIRRLMAVFQSPSYRGGSTPITSMPRRRLPCSGFNPLLIGAGALPGRS